MIHSYRIYTQKPTNVSKEEANQIIDEWKKQNTPWAQDPADHSLEIMETDLPSVNTEYFSGEVRFEFEDDANQLTQDIKYGLSNLVSWARIGYHECDHDGDGDSNCDYKVVAEFGTVPDDVPTFV
jgi:hypothetical protein